MGQFELPSHLEMTLEAGLGRFAGIDNRVRCAATFHMLAPGAVAGFAAHVLAVRALRHEPGMGRGAEVTHDLFMAIGAFFCADEFRAGNGGRRHDCAVRRVHRAAREQNHREGEDAAERPKNFFVFFFQPGNDFSLRHARSIASRGKIRLRISSGKRWRLARYLTY